MAASSLLTELRETALTLVEAKLGQQIAVKAWPKSIKQLPSPRGKGLIILRPQLIKSMEPRDVQQGRLLQQRRAFIEFRIFVQMLRDSNEADPILEGLDDALSAVTPDLKTIGYSADFPGFWHVESGLVADDDKTGVWDFGAIYALDMTYRKRR
ncbi:MAG: hypothetical protein AAGD09_11590 [Cyanobacteria bacterium P01_F01_bin.56]